MTDIEFSNWRSDPLASPLLWLRAEVQSCLLRLVPPHHFSCALRFLFFARGLPMAFLLVDADRNFREVIAIGLRLDGHEVVTAAEPEDALRCLALGGVDCCVVDFNVIGAEELLVAAGRAGVRLVMTGVHPALLAGAVRRHPAAELLPKPFQAGELLVRT